MAARAIAALGATPDQIRGRVGAGPVPDPTLARARISLTPQAKKVIELSLHEALSLGHYHIGTEHLLPGILAEGKDTGARVRTELGITQESARAWIIQALDEIAAARSRAQ